jgi:hypothetical protein
VADEPTGPNRLPNPVRRFALAADWQRDEQDRERRRRALEELNAHPHH